MTDRVIEIASPARLRVRDAQLVIEMREEGQLALPFTTPMSEIAVLLLAHPQVTLSQAVLSGIAACGGSVITIDSAFLPASMLLPLQVHSVQTERFAMQARIGLPARKRLWKEIVIAKIRAQGELLRKLHTRIPACSLWLHACAPAIQKISKRRPPVATGLHFFLGSLIFGAAPASRTKTGILTTVIPCYAQLPHEPCVPPVSTLRLVYTTQTGTTPSRLPQTSWNPFVRLWTGASFNGSSQKIRQVRWTSVLKHGYSVQ